MGAWRLWSRAAADYVPSDEELEIGFASIPAVPGVQAAGGLPLA